MSSLAVLTGSDFGPGDPKQERAITERRRLEAERLKRIKDPKSRIMGIDVDALSEQVAEKQLNAAAERSLRLDYDMQRLQQDSQLAYLEQERLRAERTKLQYLDEFRKEQQGKERSREYDLNDPLSKKNDRSCATGARRSPPPLSRGRRRRPRRGPPSSARPLPLPRSRPAWTTLTRAPSPSSSSPLWSSCWAAAATGTAVARHPRTAEAWPPGLAGARRSSSARSISPPTSGHCPLGGSRWWIRTRATRTT